VPKPDDAELLSIDGHAVRISHPDKLYFSQQVKLTKLDLVRYFLSVAPGALNGIQGRPIVLKRFVNGAEGEPFYQKRAPSDLPPFLRTVMLSFPSGRTADEVVVDTAAGLAWIVNLGCMELHPHPVQAADLDHPDQLRVDLDPGPGVEFAAVRLVAIETRALLDEMGLRGFPKTSGSRGIHVNVPIHPQWTFTEVRRAALALARAVERRVPLLASSKWWKEERHGVFLDYNQNAKDRTTASAYSVRPLPDARVSMPLEWHEVPDCNPADFTVLTAPARFAELGDPHAEFGAHAGTLEGLLDLAARDEREGLGDAPWPPHFAKAAGEAPRVAPSRARKAPAMAPAESSVKSSVQPSIKSRAGSKMPLITIANSPDKAAALSGLNRWKALHPEAAALLAVDDVLVDRMRGTAYIWYRIRVNLRNVPEAHRPNQEKPDPDDHPTR
jgi:bifunctional non-homologous end joining protein LigD